MISLYTGEPSPDIHSKAMEFEKDPFSIIVDKICELVKGLWEAFVAVFSSDKKLPVMTASTEEIDSETGSEQGSTDVISEVFHEVQSTISGEIKNESSDFNLTRMIKQGNFFAVEEQEFQRSNQPSYTEDTQYDEEVEKIKGDLKTKVEATFSNPTLQKAVLAAFSRDLFLQDYEERIKALLETTYLLKADEVLQPYDDENKILDAKSGITTHILSDKRVYIKKQSDKVAIVEIQRRFHILDNAQTDTSKSIEVVQKFHLDEKGTVSNLGIGTAFF